MRAIIEESRRRLLSAADTVCLERARLVTEAYREWADDPAPLRRAKALDHILANMTLDLQSNPIFAGNTSTAPRAWMLLPEYGFAMPGQALIENPSLQGHLDGDAVPADLRAFWQERSAGGAAGIGHLAVNLGAVLSQGLGAIAEKAERLAADQPDPTKAAYRRACALACRAVVGWAGRYADAAGRAAAQTKDRGRRAALGRVAAACRRVPAEPAGDLFEALQAIVLVHLAIHIEGHGYSVSPGRLDRTLEPYYRGEPDATELLAAFMLKVAANSLWGSHSKTQCITVGGVDAAGRDCCNALTMKVLQAAELARAGDPHVFVRWHRNVSAGVKRKAMEMLAGGMGMPMLVGDEQTAAGLMAAGVSEADAWDYCILGCNELGVPGKLMYDTVSVNGAALLRDVLLNEAGAGGIADMDALLDRLGEALHEDLRRRTAGRRNWQKRRSEIVPTPLTSTLMDGCVERGADLQESLAYNLPTVTERGTANLINGLAAIQQVVFTDRAATLAELAEALEGNFEGADALRRRLLAAPKWGNDDESADRWALPWLELRERIRRAVESETRSPPHLTSHVVRSLHHLEGRQLGATPDGRRAGEPLADSVGAQLGTAAEGPTAVLNSVCKLQPARFWTGGYNLNLTLPAVRPDEGDILEKLIAMVDVFFSSGGQELQLGLLDAAALTEAQAHPRKYPDLLVRVAGFNARFVDLPRAEQDELIARAASV